MIRRVSRDTFPPHQQDSICCWESSLNKPLFFVVDILQITRVCHFDGVTKQTSYTEMLPFSFLINYSYAEVIHIWMVSTVLYMLFDVKWYQRTLSMISRLSSSTKLVKKMVFHLLSWMAICSISFAALL